MPGMGWGSFIGQAAGMVRNPTVQNAAQTAIGNLNNEGVRNAAQSAYNVMTSPGAQRAASYAQQAASRRANFQVGSTPFSVGTSRTGPGGGRAKSTWMRGSLLDNKGTPWWQASQFKVGQPQIGGTDWRQMNDLSVKRIPPNGRRMNFGMGLPQGMAGYQPEWPQEPQPEAQALAQAPSAPGTGMTPTGEGWNTTNIGEATMKTQPTEPFGSLASQYPNAIDVSSRDRVGEFGAGIDAGRMQALESGPPRTVGDVGRKPKGKGSRSISPDQEILPGFENV